MDKNLRDILASGEWEVIGIYDTSTIKKLAEDFGLVIELESDGIVKYAKSDSDKEGRVIAALEAI